MRVCWLLALCAPLMTPLVAWAQAVLSLEILSPAAASSSPREVVHVLGRTQPGATVKVGGEPVTVYATGVFARDRIPLVPGANRIVIEARLPDGQMVARTLDLERTNPPPAPVWPVDRLFIDSASIRPAEALRVAPGEPVEVALRATAGQRVEARLPGSKSWQALRENSPGRYRALLGFEGHDDVASAPVELRITALALPRSAKPRTLLARTPGELGQWRDDPERLFVVGADGAELLHGLHEVRLGGPFLAELPAGTLLHITGRQGDFLRVQLAPDTTAWVAEKALSAAAPGTPRPRVHFSNVAVIGEPEGDLVTIPLTARVPYAVRAVSDAAGRHSLEVDLFGAHHAATWISQRASARVVREVTVEQAGPERVRVRIALQGPRLWGWRSERTGNALRVRVMPAPTLAATGSPLAGLRIAVEAGHGSNDNRGAVGATGTPEKDINRWTADALKAELEAAGAQVIVVRDGDDNPPLRERARRVLESPAQLFVSVHANATDTGAGFLRVSGTSTFYKHTTSRDLAAAVQRRMLEQTGLEDFGLVGNFNYAPIRLVTSMPSVLVEQAFVTHPGDEARLLDPAFRATIARAVRLGLEDFLRAP